LVLLLMAMAVSLAYAQGIGSQVIPKPQIDDLALLARGLAVDAGNSSSFVPVAIGAGSVRFPTNMTVVAGVMIIDTRRFTLENINITNSSISGNIFRNATQAGSFSVSSVIKNSRTAWYGAMTLNERNFNLYLLSLSRPITAQELGDKISNYCSINPGDSRCKAGGIMINFCKHDASNPVCREMLRNSCLNNPNDERCRTEFNNFCKDDPGANGCNSFIKKSSQKFCDRHMNAKRCEEINGRVIGGQMNGMGGMKR